MSVAVDVRRSCLSVPGSEVRKVTKAFGLGADEVVFDLEDSVAPAAKLPAREGLVSLFATLPPAAAAVAIRVNAVGTEWCHQDILALVAARGVEGSWPGSLVIPKVEHPGDIEFVDRLLTGIEAGTGGPRIGIQALVETAAGLHRVDEIAAASPRLQSLILGYADLSAALGRTYNPRALDIWLPAQHAVLLAARRHGIQAIDGPYLDFSDDEGAAAANTRARDIGFDGKWVIHPRQIDPVNAAFTPSAAEVERARAVDAALERAELAGAGAVALDGGMVDLAVALAARRTLARFAAAQRPGNRAADRPAVVDAR